MHVSKQNEQPMAESSVRHLRSYERLLASPRWLPLLSQPDSDDTDNDDPQHREWPDIRGRMLIHESENLKRDGEHTNGRNIARRFEHCHDQDWDRVKDWEIVAWPNLNIQQEDDE